ncbi:YhgE/Pip domain-containing protein [Salipaludibacillus daqingensis]|uniref:YhgE/Pip domain-containing protein n=1 Tax=Salipaludibacillus daqingensis TaxID=3041001 RepID=UPI002474D2D4|nr:YhgE/Pip domain-containing protein [Salipaludibacillus daqingensis]
MKNKRILRILMVLVLILPSFLVTGASNEHVAVAEDTSENTGEYSSKDEVVYATLSPSGERQEVYVVNIFDVMQEGNISDFGTYSNLKNLTDLSEIEQKEDTVEFTAPEGKFYYQGDKNDAYLPWDISISYLLDGNKIDPEELAGKDGDAEIKIQTSANENVDSVFFDNYLLQISLHLEPEIFDNIETEDGVVANAGKNKQVTFTVMPEQAGELTMKADVVDFELQGMDIVAVPQSMSIDAPDMDDMTGEITSLTDAIKKISNGVGELNNGVSDLNSGVASLRDGSGEYEKGISDIDGASYELIDASESIDEGLATMSTSLNESSGEMDVTELRELPDGLSQLADGLHQTVNGLDNLNENYTVAYSTLDEAMVAIPDYDITEEEIEALYMSGADSDVVDQLVETYAAARTAKGTYSAVKEAFAAVEPSLDEVSGSIEEMANTMESMATEIGSSVEDMDAADSIGELQEGLATLSNNYKEFHDGLVSYTNGVGQLSSSYKDIHAGIVELSGGTGELEDGVEELDTGTDTLYESTKDMPDQMQEEVDEMIADYDKSDVDTVSFVSAENEKINSVQFVIKTESIEKEEQESNEEQEEEQKGFWDRLMDLFKA